ncbi:MAG TPA: hypothetical protein VJQ25_01895 [Nitrospira sp.]|jgi:hypothetical protein|nr:hypothetical protein [Nitrospira sp.]
MMKPILFHDIDGVLFGEYAGEYQLRPGVSSWLRWICEHFDLVWLTAWERDRVHGLLRSLYLEDVMKSSTYGNWTNYANKETWLREAVSKLDGRPWFWIDDIQDDLSGLPAERCIRVIPIEERELERLKEDLAQKAGLSVCQSTRKLA